MTTGPATLNIYRIAYLLKGSNEWDILAQEFTSLNVAKKVAQLTHDKYLNREGEPCARVTVLKSHMSFELQVMYDGGCEVATPS